MIYKMEDLVYIADNALRTQAGLGNKRLHKNSESWAPYLRFLGLAVANYKPHACLELGVYMGTATTHMAFMSPRTLVIGVDREYHPAFPKVTEGYDNIVQIVGDTTLRETRDKVSEALELVDPLNKQRIGLLFLDSTHDGVTPKQEYELYSPFFDEECLVCCDDLIGPKHLEEKMKEFWDWLPGEKKEMNYLHPRRHKQHDEPGFGISIVRRNA